MSQRAFPSQWTDRYTDPYAVLGISVVSDDRRVLKRYREVAKVLHPDRYVLERTTDKEFATQLFARLVNPAYEQVKQEQGRRESSANLRFRVRRLCKEGPLSPQSAIARQLMEHPASGVDVFYEQAMTKLAEAQYQNFDEFNVITDQISELNLVYLQLKISETLYHERREGLVTAKEAKPVQFTPAQVNPEIATESYDQRHYRRAQAYAKKGAWPQAIQELRDALKIKADKSEYHALIGVAYLFQEFPGMAKAHLKRAMALDPKNPLVVKYGPKVGVLPNPAPQGTNGRTSPTRTHGQPNNRQSAHQSSNGRATNGRVTNGRSPNGRVSSSNFSSVSKNRGVKKEGSSVFTSFMNWLRSLFGTSSRSTPTRPIAHNRYTAKAPQRTKVR
jgi:tetratricopeptide (TPR) repeat protein